MASGVRINQRVGTMDSVQREPLGKTITDPHNGRVFQYVKVLDLPLGANRACPIAAVGTQVTSMGYTKGFADFINEDRFSGLQTASVIFTSNMYLWVLRKGWLGQDSQSELYSGVIFCRTDDTAQSNDLILGWGREPHGAGAEDLNSAVNNVTFDSLQAHLCAAASNTGAATSIGSAMASMVGWATKPPMIIGWAGGDEVVRAFLAKGFINSRWQA